MFFIFFSPSFSNLLSYFTIFFHNVMHFTFVFQSKDNDAATQLPVTSESPAAEQVNEATTTKATLGDMQGELYDKAVSCRGFVCLTLHFNVFSPLFYIEMSTPLTEPQASRRPRFLTPNRSKRNVETRCPRTVFLPGVSSLKGAH